VRGAKLIPPPVRALRSAGGARALHRIRSDLASRRRVETAVHVTLVVCSTIAVLVTLGIVFSLIAETVRFFERVGDHATNIAEAVILISEARNVKHADELGG
jgi:phosphate transport system permease protein